mmetsp:Transcript_50297/g.75128  ORF Transcript_50297/g.75128 Transcript_50297/m.75128 type:complete len:316 (-) Transcript_50297:80-1027(-)|eukprot:CAMPEP_0194036696 /NCGR_PEP_ID=MMETSP0009_2-20130614/9066_1 /TAXON_ID=210454 /ORGANISM="Grammatophora oceanica, Strain CCMP 410" /LENGTH=315 /DNA_ID=CAMNT_0038678565 /DNA_START=116 /DNA_END=1063 /DNA_ORIENTATION=+
MDSERRRALLDVTWQGDLDALRELVEQRNVNPNTIKRFSPLHFACMRQHFEIVQYLVGDCHVDIDATDASEGMTALHFACRKGSLRMVQYLANVGGADPEFQSTFARHTPLHVAALNGHLEIVQYLIEKKQANTDAKASFGKTPLHLAIHFRQTEVVEYLLPISVVDKAVLKQAWTLGFSWEVKRNILELFGKHQGFCDGKDDCFSSVPLHTVLRFPLSDAAVEECIQNFPASAISTVDRNGRFPIHIALEASKSPFVIALMLDQSPRLALVKDPITGLHPFETSAAAITSSSQPSYLSLSYQLLRFDPEYLLQG